MIQLLILYWILLQAILSSFSGLTSLPVIRHDLVVDRQWIDDVHLNAAVMIGRSTPGPMGVYVVCIGYFVAGYPGALVGMLALATPALLMIALLHFLHTRVDHPRVKNAIRFVVIGGTGFSAATLVGMGQAALTSGWLIGIALTSCLLVLRTRIATIWILTAAGIVAVMVK
ncbi:chromate transporter [Bryobacter aggregatus]|uniref:chromate transporter n=1 Tax=Bryobacter aggregatus TaxID=360054 RepID=UPI00068D5AEE|nr:chromate transporter [Bryobacter aggregatus]